VNAQGALDALTLLRHQPQQHTLRLSPFLLERSGRPKRQRRGGTLVRLSLLRHSVNREGQQEGEPGGSHVTRPLARLKCRPSLRGGGGPSVGAGGNGRRCWVADLCGVDVSCRLSLLVRLHRRLMMLCLHCLSVSLDVGVLAHRSSVVLGQSCRVLLHEMRMRVSVRVRVGVVLMGR